MLHRLSSRIFSRLNTLTKTTTRYATHIPKLSVINPSTNKIEERLDSHVPTYMIEQVEILTKGQKAWAKVPLKERINIILNYKTLLEKKEEELAQGTTKEMGKPITQSHNEIRTTRDRIQWFCDNVEEATKDQVVYDKKGEPKEMISYEPLGIIANISAWNYPYFVGTNVYIPALLTGNAVIYKPSEYVLTTGRNVVNLLHEAGVPKDALSIILGGPNMGAELLRQPFNGYFFTGSYSTGMKVVLGSSKHFPTLGLELGGKDPAYVHKDVDVTVAAHSLADGAFYNAGQSCCAVERIYVHADVYDAFVSKFVETVKGFKVGPPKQKDTYLGPVSREAGLKIVEDQLKDATAKGAQILLGGRRLPGVDPERQSGVEGFYFSPTVVTNTNHDMTMMKEETFGPMIGIQKVESVDEAVNLMNDTVYGLTAAVFSKDEKIADSILGQMNTGTVYWNCCDRVSVRLPWSGRKHSGIGLTGSLEGIRAFTKPKSWFLNGDAF
eukprot:TRINITY_DN6997_c0_g1_i1.p1 TRINITY_DN6997_c0_g1~~TRINITY_DN6997_c0_g1_i1.p1  ORF type:complete len:496 (-),score=102.11 TRINITY_DN6997_c0_g1_i1:147-1634(-)